DALVRELANDAAKLKLGPGTDPKATLGPVIRGERKAKLIEYIDGAQVEGAQLVSDGRSVELKDGFFLGPTIFDRVTPNMKIWKEELFGPVLSVMRASDIDEALNLLNASTYGNMASIFTGSGKYAREFKRRAQAGMLGVNIGVAAPMAFFPFTGWKNSFFGDLHATGQDSRRIIEAIRRQAEKLGFANPFMAHEPRALLGKKLAELLPGDIDKVFFTLGGAEANENAVKLARAVTGRYKIVSRYRSYHG